MNSAAKTWSCKCPSGCATLEIHKRRFAFLRATSKQRSTTTTCPVAPLKVIKRARPGAKKKKDTTSSPAARSSKIDYAKLPALRQSEDVTGEEMETEDECW